MTPLGLNKLTGNAVGVKPLGCVFWVNSKLKLEHPIANFRKRSWLSFRRNLVTALISVGKNSDCLSQTNTKVRRALNDGSLLNDNEQAIYSSIYVYEHTGWVLGYYSIARYHEDIDTVVIQFVNTTLRDTELTTIVVYDRIVRILRRQ